MSKKNIIGIAMLILMAILLMEFSQPAYNTVGIIPYAPTPGPPTVVVP